MNKKVGCIVFAAAALFIGMLISIGQHQPVSTAVLTESTTTLPSTKPEAPKHHWTVDDPEVNPMDHVVTQFVANDGPVRVVLCYKNGKPCAGDSVPLYIKGPGHCFIESNVYDEQYKRRIRVKFDDDEKPSTEIWGISTDHEALIPPFPSFREINHKLMMLEFGCDESDSAVVTQDIEGLQEILNRNGSLRTSNRLPANRKANTTDEYAMLVARYGQPDSVELESKAKFPMQLVHYQTAHTKVLFVANGCVQSYEDGLEVISTKDAEMARRMKQCVPLNSGWTIVGYILTPDSTHHSIISAEAAEMYLNTIKNKRTVAPVQK